MLVLTLKEKNGATIYDKDGNVLGKVVLIKQKSGSQARVGFEFDREMRVERFDLLKEVPRPKRDPSP